jgi:dTDP-glucose 4,6-dehydratase
MQKNPESRDHQHEKDGKNGNPAIPAAQIPAAAGGRHGSIREHIERAGGHFPADGLLPGKRSILVRRDVRRVSRQGPRPDEIIVPLAAIFAAERPHKEKGQDGDFEQAPAMRTPYIKATAGRTTTDYQTALVMHELGAYYSGRYDFTTGRGGRIAIKGNSRPAASCGKTGADYNECRARQTGPESCTGGYTLRAVITGGAGFLGSHLCDYLIERDWEVLCIDNLVTGSEGNVGHLMKNPAFKLVRHDVSKHIEVPGPVDYVLHFASPASPPDYLKLPIQTLKVGALGTHNSLGLALAKKAKYFLASTSECYGDPDVSPQPETYWGHVNPIGPRGVYDEAKRFAEAMTMAYHRYHGLDTHIVRIFNTYGPRMRLNDGRALPNFVYQALTGQPITVYGDGKQTRSFCYVSDLIAGIYRLMSSNEHEPTNIGNPHEITILEFAQRILKLTGSTVPIVFKPLPQDDPKQRCPDITKAKRILGWEPQVPLEEGLRRTLEYFKQQVAVEKVG